MNRTLFRWIMIAMLPLFSSTGNAYDSAVWSDDTQEKFYFTPQGSKIIPYDWAMSLLTADGRESFFSSHNLKNYGYIAQPPSDMNHDGLPIGFTRDENPAGFSRYDWLMGE